MRPIIHSIFLFVIFFFAIDAYADISSIAKEYQKGNLSKATQLSRHYKYRYLHTYLRGAEFLEKDNNASFESIANFLTSNPDVPQREELAKKIESKISSSTNKSAIIKWFSHNKPKTPNGFVHYYKASKGRIKNKEAFEKIVKNAWIFGSLSKKEADDFYERYKSILTQSDHVDKISEFLWNDKVENAVQLMYLVDKDYQKAFKAWISIIQNKPNVESAFHQVRGSYRYMPGLLYAYLKLHKKSEPTQELIALHLKSPKNTARSKEWWGIKNYLARELIDRKMFNDAYRIVSSHSNLENKADLVDAEWLSGWLALRFLNNPELAKKHFKLVIDVSKTSISKSRGYYWQARSYQDLGGQETAESLYKKAARRSHTYYGMLASVELGRKELRLPSPPIITQEDKIALNKNQYAQIAQFFSLTDKKSLLKKYAKQAFASAKTTGEIALLYGKLRKNLDLRWRVEISKLASQYGYLVVEDSFPTPYKIPRNRINEAYVYATIRQESNFDTKGLNETGREDGLMQIIPSTEKKLCNELGIKYKPKRITDPEYNIKLGIYYLSKEFAKTGSYIKTSSEYNAGPISNSWSERFGDPSSMDLKGVIDWIELIPFHVTRTYVQRVIENMQIFRYALTRSNKLRIAEDLLASKETRQENNAFSRTQ
ncbi:MAG: lytic transglycosylase domain-containing protein [Alphaproteobacteria bacterium]|nr:lytic transglycosylase domain-containing protein [Alphaproteobacteria bacterium]